jgi:dienelactone hydrolase
MRPPPSFLALVLLGAICSRSAPAQSPLGAQAVEGEPDREQQWLVPSADLDRPAHAVLFRPPGDGPFRLALIAHASRQNVLRRAQMPQPEYRALAAFLVARGFAVLVPERLGHDATGGSHLEDQGGCDQADYISSGPATAQEIDLALDFLREQSFVRHEGAVVVGHSAGGWGALALAGEDPKAVSAIVVFAPGRGGHANDAPNQVCAPHTLITAAAAFGKGAGAGDLAGGGERHVLFAGIVAAACRRLRSPGGKADFSVLSASGSEGHRTAESEGGVRLAGPELDRALKLRQPVAVKKR